MATKKSGGTVKNGRDSNPKYLGIKVNPGQFATSGSVLVRQRGTTFLAGKNTKIGKDHTIFAVKEGEVTIGQKRITHFDNSTKVKKVIGIK